MIIANTNSTYAPVLIFRKDEETDIDASVVSRLSGFVTPWRGADANKQVPLVFTQDPTDIAKVFVSLQQGNISYQAGIIAIFLDGNLIVSDNWKIQPENVEVAENKVIKRIYFDVDTEEEVENIGEIDFTLPEVDPIDDSILNSISDILENYQHPNINVSLQSLPSWVDADPTESVLSSSSSD